MFEFKEIINFGINFETAIFLITMFFTIFQAIALTKQRKKIRKEKSGKSVSFSFFSYYGFSALAVSLYGLYGGSLALVINGSLLGSLALAIVVNIPKFKKLKKEEIIAGIISSTVLPLMIILPQKDLLFLIFGLIVTFSLLFQIIEIWKNKSSGAVHLAQTIVSIFSVSFWLTYAFVFKFWPLQIINSIALILWITMLFSYLKYKVKPTLQ